MFKPLDAHAEMYISASHSRLQAPCLGLVRVFNEPISQATFDEHANALASNPHGLGRRVVRPRVPGARSRWTPSNDLPPLRFETEPHDAFELSRMLNEEISGQPDPLRNLGWRLAAAPTESGGTFVINWANHAFGDARSVLENVFGPNFHETRPALNPDDQPTPIRELSDVVTRVRSGVTGSLRLGRDVAKSQWSQNAGEMALLAPTIEALRRRDRSVGTLSSQRVAALVKVKHDDWKSAAADLGGSSNTLFLAMLANLIRGARAARGCDLEPDLRILLPVDIREHLIAAGADSATLNNSIIASTVVLPGGRPRHEDLTGVRLATKEAVVEAMNNAPQQLTSTRPPGIVDAMSLMPNAITHRIATRVQANVDGVASNIGPMPEFIARIGPHVAEDIYMIASPMRTDLTGAFGRRGPVTTLSFVADPARVGPGGTLRDRVEEELDAWGVPAQVQ